MKEMLAEEKQHLNPKLSVRVLSVILKISKVYFKYLHVYIKVGMTMVSKLT